MCIRWILVAVLLLPHATALATADPEYLTALVARSRELKLAERPEWLKLLHFMRRPLSIHGRSLVDSAEFFNAPGGKTDPTAELEATLAAFFSQVEETPERQNPQCAFIARRAWLDEQLRFDRRRLPLRECHRFEAWHAALDPVGLTLVFPSAYLNNPSSMYGHTLLRVDGKGQDDRTRLLAYSLNFAAATDDTNGLAFAVKGLFGGYPGGFSLLPYYMKVREYSDLESRDIWEYELGFTPEEVDRILRHAWELLPAYFEYFFIDENCSYHLLGLLQVGRPELDLVAPFRWFALPSDTVRAIAAEPGLVRSTVFRPAIATVIGQQVAGMSEDERRITKELSVTNIGATHPRLGALSPERAAAVLEAAHEYAGFRRAAGKKDTADPAGLARELLVARSRIDVPSQAPAILAPAVRPDEGHGSSRLSVGAGRRIGRDFQELRLRPAYHDILDADAGYVRGAQIEFFSATARRYAQGRLRLERFTPIDILSLSPRDEFFQSWSWAASAGWRRAFVRDGSEPLVAGAEVGVGGAWSAAGGRALFYTLLDGSARAHRRLEENHSIGAGLRAGALLDAGPRWRLHLHGRALSYFAGEKDRPRAIGVEQRFALGRHLALRLDLERRREAGRTFGSGSLSLQVYF